MILAHKTIKLEKVFMIKNPAKLCAMPYPGHPQGCPNLGRSKNWWENKPDCPPEAQRLEEKYDLRKDCFLIVIPFDIAVQKQKMLARHPNWSDKQAACCLYWQNGVRKELRTKCNTHQFNYLLEKKEWLFEELIPEAMGLNVFATMRWHGIKMYRNPQEILYKVAFMGIKR